MSKNGIKLRIKAFWLKYENKIVLIIGFILISAISFEAGFLKGENWRQKPIIIEKTVQTGITSETAQNPSPSSNLDVKNVNQQSIPPQNCAFVGSKNSNKYHIPTCRWAKQIKPENIVCFSSAEDAVSKGYQPGCLK
jgi:hypothetical protein